MDAEHEEKPSSEDQSEPSVFSEVKEERILARRKRVQERIEAARREALGEEPHKEEVVEVDPERERKGRQQEEKSGLRLEKLVTDGSQLVSNVAVAGDSKEVLRRQEEEEARRARYEKLEAEVTAGAERFDEIMRKWSEGKGKRVPQELQDLLSRQKSACSAMIDEKDKLISEFQQELKAKDDRYVKNLKKQAEDVDLLLERMEEQNKTLLKAHSEELREIEKAFQVERCELLEQEKGEWEKAMQQRAEREKWSLEEREKRIGENEAELQHMRVRHSEEFNRIKMKLETDIQILQQQIQQMKATFQLNAEKLEYNFQVLRKRDEENTVTISHQKRKVTRLQDTLTTQKAKLVKQEKLHHDELQALMEEYRKNTEQYRELQKKVKHFQLTDTKRFHDIWRMNEDRARSLAREVLHADETIYQQQLGLEWQPPLPVESPMTAVATEREASRATLYASQILSEAGSEPGSLAEGSMVSVTAPAAYPPSLIRQVLELLCEESGFLVESKLARLLAPLDKEEQILMKVDSVFKALGIETEEDVHKLVTFFICKAEEKRPDTESSLSEEDSIRPQLIHPNEVPQALRRFTERKHASSEKPLQAPSALQSTVGHKKLLDGVFWKEIAEVLPESHERVWSALTEGLDQYYSALQARSRLIQETDSLRQQNIELRLLLHQYMHARINQELEIPPTLMLPVPSQAQ